MHREVLFLVLYLYERTRYKKAVLTPSRVVFFFTLLESSPIVLRASSNTLDSSDFNAPVTGKKQSHTSYVVIGIAKEERVFSSGAMRVHIESLWINTSNR